MKKVLLSILVLISCAFLPLTVFADKKETEKETVKETEKSEDVIEKEKIKVYLFWGNGCGFCERAKTFFASIEEEYSKYYEMVSYEVWHDKNNQELMQNVADYMGDEVGGVPYIVIGDKTFGGYNSSYDEDIKNAIKNAYEDEDYVDFVAKVRDEGITAKNYDTYIVIGIFVLLIGGFGALIYFSRK